MALWICRNCSAAYAVELFRCPQCRSSDYSEEGSDVPKVTVHGGASDKDVPDEVEVPQEESLPPEEVAFPAEEVVSEEVNLEVYDEPEAAPPPRNAAKEHWVDWAVDRGMDEEEASSMTRDELIAWWYGQ